MLVLMTAPVSADTTGTAAVTGVVAEYISITAAPDTIELNLQPDATATNSTLVLTVSRNNPYVVTVADNTGRAGGALTANQGYMQNFTAGAYVATPVLASPLHLDGLTVGTNEAKSLTFPISSAQTFYAGSAAVHDQALSTVISQAVSYTDPAISTYKMQLIFTIQAP